MLNIVRYIKEYLNIYLGLKKTMKDIKIDSFFMKSQYFMSWINFIIFGTFITWVIVLVLVSYGRVTSNDIKKQKGVLNKTWQKFIFVFGFIVSYLIMLSVIGLVLISLFPNTSSFLFDIFKF